MAILRRAVLFVAGFYVVADAFVLIVAGIHGTGPFLLQHLYEGPAILLLFIPLTLQWLFIPSGTGVGLEALAILAVLAAITLLFERGRVHAVREVILFYFLALPAITLVLIEVIPALF